jgi:peptide/nickel transport system permease protein
MKHLAARGSLAILGLIGLHAAVLVAGFLAPYDPSQQNRASALQAPMGLHFFDQRGVFHARPFVAGDQRLYPLRFLVAGSPYRLLGLGRLRTHLFGVDEPGRVFLMGSDEFGRDQFSRMLWGGQISLATGWLAAFLALALGLGLGLLAGFFGGWTDAVVMRAAELFLALPWLYLLLVVRAFLPLSLSPWTTALAIALVIGAIGWTRPARLIRGVVLSAKEREFVYASRGFGASAWHLIRKHCLPETYGVVATQAALLVPQFILAEVTLSFVGLGIGDPAVSLGSLLAPLRQIAVIGSAWWMALPTLLVVWIAWCFSRLEDTFVNSSRASQESE